MLGAVLARIGRVNANHRAIARGMVFVALFLLLGKAAGALKEMAVAYRYGVSAEVDAYLFVMTFVTWPAELAFGLLMGVVVPLAATLRVHRPDALRLFRGELLGLTLLTGVVVAAIFAGVAYWGLGGALGGLSAEMVANVRAIAPALLVLVPMLLLISLWSMWTAASGRHANTLVEGVSALCIALVVVVAGGIGIEALVWGTVAGYALHLAALGIPLARRGEIDAPRVAYSSPEWQAFWRGFGLVLGSQALLSSTQMIDQFFAANQGPGAVAALGYANRVLALVIGLGATAVGRATLPVFSNANARGDTAMRRVAYQWAAIMFGLGLVAMVVSWVLAPHIIRILFERGAFGADETATVTAAFRYGLAQLPFYFPGLVLASYCSSHRRYMLLFWSGIFGFSVKVVANLLLVPPLGINGLALSWAFVYGVNTLFFLFAIRRIR